MLNALRELQGVERVFPFGNELHITAEKPLDLDTTTNALAEKGLKNVELHAIEPGIEDLFMHLMQ